MKIIWRSRHHLSPVPRFRAIESCVDEGCKCDDRVGVVLYDGSDLEEARRNDVMARTGYHFLIEKLVEGEWEEVTTT